MGYSCILQLQGIVIAWWDKSYSLSKHTKVSWKNKIELFSVNSSCPGTRSHSLLQGKNSSSRGGSEGRCEEGVRCPRSKGLLCTIFLPTAVCGCRIWMVSAGWRRNAHEQSWKVQKWCAIYLSNFTYLDSACKAWCLNRIYSPNFGCCYGQLSLVG